MKKYIKRIICTIFAISMILVGTIPSQASSSYYKSIDSLDGKCKVGNYYIRVNSDSGIYVSKSKSSSGKRIVSGPVDYSIVTNGSKIYYSKKTTYTRFNPEIGIDKAYSKIYKIDVTGRNKVYLGKTYHGEALEAYYNGKLFLNGDYMPEYSNVYVYNLKTKKEYLLKRDVEANEQKGRYLLLGQGMGDYIGHKISVYNAYSKKFYKISSTGEHAKFLNGKVYYADLKYLYNTSNPSSQKISIKTSSYTGSHKRTLCTIHMPHGGDIKYIGKSYVKYNKGDSNGNSHTYKCYYSSKRVVRLD